MIAVISSTIYPPAQKTRDGVRSWNSPESRLEQTQKTIQFLVDEGISKIYLADNSGVNWIEKTDQLLNPAKVYVFKQHQYQNKGISELYLLLSILELIPENEPIIKISGRYMIKNNPFKNSTEYDFQARFYEHRMFRSSISTRCYWVKNREVYKIFLERTLREIFSYSSRIVGPASLVRIIYNSIFPDLDKYPYDDPRCSIELASALAIKHLNYTKCKIAVLGIEGYIAGNLNDILKE